MSRRPDKTRSVFMVGFMGAGKTSVGKVLARRLGRNFYDLDEVIERREQASIAALFAAAGESGFRTIESAALQELIEQLERPGIIALGGGAFVQKANRETLQRTGGTTVLLEAPLEELQRRCSDGGCARPLAQDGEKFRQLFASRQHAYALADFHVQTDGKSIEQVAEEVEQLLANELNRKAEKSEANK
jgi:shikimate kinase